MLDGHHRLIAADLLGLETVPVSYSGVVSWLAWLQGDGDRPDDLVTQIDDAADQESRKHG